MVQPIRTTIHDRRIVVAASDELPDGTEVVVKLSSADEKFGLDEAEWDNSPASMADWSRCLTTIEPVDFAQPDAIAKAFRRSNIEAVQRQMFGEAQ